MINQLFLTLSVIEASLFDWWQTASLAGEQLRAGLTMISSQLLGKNSTDVILSLVFGAERDLNSSLLHTFRVIGMLHIWSASGLNVSIFLTTIDSFLHKLTYINCRIKTILLLLSLFFFWCMSGRGPSMQRAVFMTAIALMVRRYGFKQMKTVYALFYAVALILILQPNLVNSLSLQLSVAATLGIIKILPVVNQVLFTGLSLIGFFSQKTGELNNSTRLVANNPSGQKSINSGSRQSIWQQWLTRAGRLVNSYICRNFALFLSVQLALLPLISITWGEISFLAVLTNTILAGCLPFLVKLGLAWCGWCCLVGLVELLGWAGGPQLMARLISLVFSLPFQAFLDFSHWLAEIEAGAVKIPAFQPWQMWLWYGLWLLAAWWWRRRSTRRKLARYQLLAFQD